MCPRILFLGRLARTSTHPRAAGRILAGLSFERPKFAFFLELDASLNVAYGDNDFYHIEMFEAVAGKAHDLLDQRRMENEYLTATGQTANMIFRRSAGSDVDVFTIGFHKSLEAFAAIVYLRPPRYVGRQSRLTTLPIPNQFPVRQDSPHHYDLE